MSAGWAVATGITAAALAPVLIPFVRENRLSRPEAEEALVLAEIVASRSPEQASERARKALWAGTPAHAVAGALDRFLALQSTMGYRW